MTLISKLALVTGASGTVGPALVRNLLKKGYRVRVLLRSTPEAGLLPDDIETATGDITDPASLQRAVEGVDAVFHLAAKLHINDPNPELAAEYQRVNVQGTQHLVKAATGAGVRRFIHFSTINVYGPGGAGITYSEASPAEPDTLYGRTKVESENVALEGHPGATVLRLAAVYGPRMRGNYPLLLKALGKGVSVMVGDGTNRRTLVHVEDVARAAVLAAEREEAVGKVYNVTDGQIHTFDELARAMQYALGRKERMMYLPAAPFRGVLGLADRVTGVVGVRLPIGANMIDKLTEDMAVEGALLQQELDFRPRYSLREGWSAVVAR